MTREIAQSWVSDLPGAHLVEGRWLADGHVSDGDAFLDLDPASGSPIVELQAAGEATVARAVSAAVGAFRDWSRWRPADREKLLHRLADLVERDLERLTSIESLDVGKPILAAEAEVEAAPEIIRFFAGIPTKAFGQHIVTGDPDIVCFTAREPVGVVAAITPWNYPLLIAINKLAAILAAGCTAVIKPPPEAPLSTIALAELAMEAGIPPGVLNLVLGGSRTGEALVSSEGVAKVTFTGSTATGSAILTRLASRIRPAVLELGGKAPNVVLDDADPEAVVDRVLEGAFFNAGQECCAGARILVQESIADEFISCALSRLKDLSVGDPTDPDVVVGPLITADHRRRTEEFLGRAIKDGGEIIAQASTPESAGFFFPPTLVSAPQECEINREEVFGPVATVSTFHSDDEALHLGNDTRFGLAAGIWTNDLSRALRFSAQLDSGQVWINSYFAGDPAAPFGGYKNSGFGREMGLEGVAEFWQTKTVYIKPLESVG